MNRIVIIGNGFDLAHGLRTGYKHFIDHIKDEFRDIVNKRDLKGMLEHDLFYFKPKSSRAYESIAYVQLHIAPDYQFENWDALNEDFQVHFHLVNNGHTHQTSLKAQIEFKNKLLEYVFEQSLTDTWGGFEEDYKNLLMALLQELPIDPKDKFEGYTVRQLNLDLAQIIDLLYDYLKNIKPINKADQEKIKKLYGLPLINWKQGKEYNTILGTIPDGNDKEVIATLKHVLFLSFNYTPTIQNYLINNLRRDNLEKIVPFNLHIGNTHSSLRYIHGDLNYGGRSSMIFGYGDEMNSLQSQLEMQNNEFLKHMKSVLYTQSPSYREVIDYADADKFDIIIYGHSCSNSDRTLLNTLFEHKNCVSIQPFLHDVNDTSIYFNIYRCFKNKQLMRSRVVDETNTIRI